MILTFVLAEIWEDRVGNAPNVGEQRYEEEMLQMWGTEVWAGGLGLGLNQDKNLYGTRIRSHIPYWLL